MTPADYTRNFVHPDDADVVAAEIKAILQSTEQHATRAFEHRIIRRDGEVRTVSVRVDVVRDEAGNIQKWYGVNQDVTESKMMAETLRNSREMLSLAAELTHLGPWKYHPEKDCFEFTDEFYAIFGTDVAREGAVKTLEEYVREFVHPDDAWMFKTAEIEKNYVHRIIRRDGEVRFVAVQGNLVKDSAGKIINWYGAAQDITEQKAVEAALRRQTEEIRRLAYTDALTGLSNRAHLNEWLETVMEQARRGQAAGTVLYIDLDDLKTVNDTLGHSYGDAIIAEAGNRIREEAGDGAWVGRIGGDEFVVVLPGCLDRRRGVRIADGIIHALSRDIEAFGDVFHLSASIGVATYPADGATTDDILKNVDNAMYFAKQSGKNCWKFYGADMQAAAYEKMVLTNNLHRAVANKEFSLHYQPQVHIATGAIVGFEALLRWSTPENGDIPPARFIPVAEQSGLIRVIGARVLREACRFARRLADSGRESLGVAVNVSPHQLCADGFLDNVREAVREAGILPHRLEIEITESALIASLQEAISRLETLRAMGVRLALDDFGTGYSSLTYLQRLPVQTLKIDKSFIDRILDTGANKTIIRTIVDMAHQLDMTVVAEGVETAEQLEYLAGSRCDLAQGYLFSRPAPEEEAVGLLPPP
jgi:diguanylate cyclase (GGDEF)-like protein/PAS domain S-box-containing protein